MSRSERTRAALLAAAMELFAESGYDATPTAAIARRAGVSEMTLFRHFPTKESLVVEDPYDPLIADAIRARPPGEAALPAAIRGVRDAWRAVPPPEAAAVRERLRLLAGSATLRGALARGSAETEKAIEGALVAREADAGVARVVAAAVIAGLNAGLLHWAISEDDELGSALALTFRAFGEQ